MRGNSIRWTSVGTVLLLCAVFLPVPLEAQVPPALPSTPPAAEPTESASGPRVQLSANPFLLLAEWFNVEGEFALNETVSLGFTGSYLSNTDWFWDDDDDDEDLAGGTLFFRYYPQGEVLRRFYVGARLGMLWVIEEAEGDDAFPGFGLEFGYNWVFGEEDGFLLGLGTGLMRYSEGFLPLFRLVNVGWAF